MVLLSLPAGLQGASPRICALGLWSYNAFSRHKAPSSLLRGVCIPSKGMGLCRYGIFGQDLIQPTLCLKYRPSVVSENLCVCSVAFHDMVSSLSYGGCPLLPLSFYNIAKRLTNR
jgi:hypothetical protein